MAYKKKIKNREELVQFLKWYFQHIQSQAAAPEILQYIQKEELAGARYSINIRTLTMNIINTKEIEVIGREHKFNMRNVYALKKDGNKPKNGMNWFNKLSSRVKLRKFIHWYFESVKPTATSHDLLNYIREHGLEAKNYDMGTSQIVGSLRKMKTVERRGHERINYQDITVWGLKDASGK